MYMQTAPHARDTHTTQHTDNTMSMTMRLVQGPAGARSAEPREREREGRGARRPGRARAHCSLVVVENPQTRIQFRHPGGARALSYICATCKTTYLPLGATCHSADSDGCAFGRSISRWARLVECRERKRVSTFDSAVASSLKKPAMPESKHSHLTPEELAEFREIFNLVDLDKGGTISKDELKQLMTTLGLKPSKDELDAMVDEIDSDGNGEIDFDEFVTVMSRKVNTSYTPAQVKAAFKVFEKDAPNGFVTMAALEQALTTYGTEKLSLSDAQELLAQIEPDENGMVNYVEFVNMSTPQAGADSRQHAACMRLRIFTHALSHTLLCPLLAVTSS